MEPPSLDPFDGTPARGGSSTGFWLFSCRSGVSVLVGGVAMEERSLDDAPVTIQRGFGHPGVRTLQARCPICSTAARTRPGRVVRHGSYTWVGLYCIKAA